MFVLELIVPDFDLKIDTDKIVEVVGNEQAQRTRRRLRAGVSPQGHEFPSPKDGGTPLRRTGQMQNSVEAREVTNKRTGEKMIEIGPGGKRLELRKSGTQTRNAAGQFDVKRTAGGRKTKGKYKAVRTMTGKGKMRALDNIRLAKILESTLGIDIVGVSDEDISEAGTIAQRELDRQIESRECDFVSREDSGPAYGPGF